MTTGNSIDSDENSFIASVNHPSLTDKIDYIPDGSLSNQQQSLEAHSATYDNTITTENDVTTNNTSASPKESLQEDSSGDISSNWSFPYDKLEMDLLQDIPLPNVLSDIAISSSPSEDMIDHNDNDDSNNHRHISESNSKNELFDDYPLITRDNINRSFNELFDLQQQPTNTSIKEPSSGIESSQIESNVDSVHPEIPNENDQNFKDFTREQFEDMKKELEDIKKEFKRVQVEDMKKELDDIKKEFKTGLQEYFTSQEYQDFLASRQITSEHESKQLSNRSDEDIENNNNHNNNNSISTDSSSKISSLISLNQQQIEEDLRKDEEILKLRNFTDKVDQIVWDTISHMTQNNIQNSYNNEHVCERHKAWCESVLQKQLEIRKKPIDERLDETLFQLNHWSNFIRLQQDLLRKR